MKGQTSINQYSDASIKDAPNGHYVAHVNHDGPLANIAKVAKLIILVKLNGELHEPMSEFKYRGYVYMIEGPIQRTELTMDLTL